MTTTNPSTPPSTLTIGARHLRAEWSRWWSTEDLSDLYVAHHVLNDQYKLWRSMVMRTKGEVQQNIHLMKRQQKQTQAMQMQRMAAMRQMSRARGGGRGYGGGFGLGLSMVGGSSPMIAYKTMQWAELHIKLGQREFEPTEVTPNMLAVGRGQLRARRHRNAFAWMLALVLLWLGVLALSTLTALVLLAVVVLAGVTASWLAGRNPQRRRPVPPKLLFVPPKPVAGTVEEPEPEPFALREAGRTPRVARDAVRLALLKEGADLDEVELPEEATYGWRVPLVLASGTCADIVRMVPKLATTLRVGSNRILVRPADPADAARLTMSVLVTDPFAEPLPYPVRTPRSCSIRRKMSLGLSIEGETTPVALAGANILITGNPNAGKTAMIQAIAEYVTACEDAVVVDLDPVKRGMRSLGDVAALRGRTMAEIEAHLEFLVELARARVEALPPTETEWTPTPEHPAVLTVLDEFPELSEHAQQLAVRLLRIGREARVTVLLSTQDATKDALGVSIATAFNVRILMPCRAGDVPVVTGLPDAVSQGWLPHLLIPSPDPEDPADAGRFYVLAPGHRQPILRYVSPLDPHEAARRAAERVEAGVPRLVLPAGQPSAEELPDDTPQIVALLMEAFAAHDNPPELTVARIGRHLARVDPDTWGRWEKQSARQRTAMVSRTLLAQLSEAGLDIPRVRIEEDGSRVAAYRLQDIRNSGPS